MSLRGYTSIVHGARKVRIERDEKTRAVTVRIYGDDQFDELMLLVMFEQPIDIEEVRVEHVISQPG